MPGPTCLMNELNSTSLALNSISTFGWEENKREEEEIWQSKSFICIISV
jgi:hypothetical protein